MNKKITKEQIVRAVNKLGTPVKHKFEGWVGTPYGVVVIQDDTAKGNKKALNYLRKLDEQGKS